MKKFDEIYEKIYNEKNDKMENLRKKEVEKIIFFILLFLVGYRFIYIFFSHPFIFGFIFFIIITIMNKKNIKLLNKNKQPGYEETFKNEIIGSFIKECDEHLLYSPKSHLSSELYHQGDFEHYNQYHTEDYIYGKLDNKYNLKMAEVKTEWESTDADDHTTTTVLFHGMFGVIECPKTVCDYIKIHSDKGKDKKLFKITKKDKIYMDSEEFEKEFDVYGTDKIIVMQLLTADIMEMLIDFKRQSKIPYELTIKKDKLYIRFHTRRFI